MPDPRRLLILAPNWLGDAVMALPAVADLRRRYSAAHIAVAARPSVAPMFELSDLIDQVITLRWKGRVFDRFGFAADLWRLRDDRVDMAVLLPNSFAFAWAARQG